MRPESTSASDIGDRFHTVRSAIFDDVIHCPDVKKKKQPSGIKRRKKKAGAEDTSAYQNRTHLNPFSPKNGSVVEDFSTHSSTPDRSPVLRSSQQRIRHVRWWLCESISVQLQRAEYHCSEEGSGLPDQSPHADPPQCIFEGYEVPRVHLSFSSPWYMCTNFSSRASHFMSTEGAIKPVKYKLGSFHYKWGKSVTSPKQGLHRKTSRSRSATASFPYI